VSGLFLLRNGHGCTVEEVVWHDAWAKSKPTLVKIIRDNVSSTHAAIQAIAFSDECVIAVVRDSSGFLCCSSPSVTFIKVAI
jgi:hypothetical protein